MVGNSIDDAVVMSQGAASLISENAGVTLCSSVPSVVDGTWNLFASAIAEFARIPVE